MRVCPALAVSAVASAVDCVACVVVLVVVASVGAVATHVEGALSVGATSCTMISTRTILARIRRQEQEEGTRRDTRQDIRGQGPVAIPAVGMMWGHTR